MSRASAVYALFLLIAPTTLPAAGVDEMVEYRVQVMESAQRHLRAASAIVRDGVPLHPHLAEHAHALKSFSRMIPEMFPPGSRNIHSEATPAIWQRWDDFIGLTQRLGRNADVLAEAAVSGDNERMERAYTEVLETCRSCHREFRKRD